MGLDDWTPERHAEAKGRVQAAIASSHRLPPGMRDLRDVLVEIERRREEVRVWKQAQEAGDRHNDEMQAELDLLTADLAAARATIEALLDEIDRLHADIRNCLDGLRLARFETGAVARAAVQVAAYQLEAALGGNTKAKT